MSAIGVMALFLIASGADSIMEQFGFFGLMVAVAVCGIMVIGGEIRGQMGKLRHVAKRNAS